MRGFQSWRDASLCKGKLVDIWYAPLEADNQEQYNAVAREVCHVCPVWIECLNDGIDEQWGIWGGLTPLERSVFKIKPKKTALRPHGTATRYRQGCRCDTCTTTHTATMKQSKNINVVPNNGDKNYDLFTVLYQLLQ